MTVVSPDKICKQKIIWAKASNEWKVKFKIKVRDDVPLVRELLLPRGWSLERNTYHLCPRIVETVQWEYWKMRLALDPWWLRRWNPQGKRKLLRVFEWGGPIQHWALQFICYWRKVEQRQKRLELIKSSRREAAISVQSLLIKGLSLNRSQERYALKWKRVW